MADRGFTGDLTASRGLWTGVAWTLLSGLSFVAMMAVVKLLGTRLPTVQIAFMRYVLGLVFLLPVLRSLIAWRPDRVTLALFGLRGMAHGMAVILWFYAMARIPIAEITALNYLTPVYVMLGAALFLGERLQGYRIFAVSAALGGTYMILLPGFHGIGRGQVAMLGTSLMLAVSYLLTKRLVHQASPAVIVAMLSITVTIGLAPLAAAVWMPISGRELTLLFALAVLATGGHLAMTFAFRAAPLAITQPVTFVQLVWAAALGWAVFGEGIEPHVLAGGTVVLASVSYCTFREARAPGRAVV